jgi:hypothetical protein
VSLPWTICHRRCPWHPWVRFFLSAFAGADDRDPGFPSWSVFSRCPNLSSPRLMVDELIAMSATRSYLPYRFLLRPGNLAFGSVCLLERIDSLVRPFAFIFPPEEAAAKRRKGIRSRPETILYCGVKRWKAPLCDTHFHATGLRERHNAGVRTTTNLNFRHVGGMATAWLIRAARRERSSRC